MEDRWHANTLLSLSLRAQLGNGEIDGSLVQMEKDRKRGGGGGTSGTTVAAERWAGA